MFCEKIEDIYYDIRRIVTKPFYFLAKWFSYAPILWKDYEWDWNFLVELMIFKMKRMRKCILTNNIIEDAQLVHDEILECENKLKAVLEDNWCVDELEAFEKKHPEIPDMLDFRMNRWEWLNAHPAIKEEYNAIFEKMNEMGEQKFKEAFDYLRDNIRNWWD